MEIKLVSYPLEIGYTDEDNTQFSPNECWDVKTSRYREAEGGFLQWKEKLKAIEEKHGEIVVYLYSVEALHQEVITGPNETDREFDICYYIRWDYKIK